MGVWLAWFAMSMACNSKMKEAIKAGGCNTAGDNAGALNAAVEAAVASAVARCGSNGRKTIRSHDIGSGSSDSGMVVASGSRRPSRLTAATLAEMQWEQ